MAGCKKNFVKLLGIVIPLFVASISIAGRGPNPYCSQLAELRGTDKWTALENFYKGADSAEDFDETRPEAFPVLIKPLPDGETGYIAKILLIRRAKYTITIATHEIEDDSVANGIFIELMAAIDRGVSIRLLTDGTPSLTTHGHEDFHALLAYKSASAKAGTVSVRTFNDPKSFTQHFIQRWKANILNLFSSDESRITPIKNWLDRRMHDKILIVDEDYPELSMAVNGGRNLLEAPHGLPVPRPDMYSDIEFVIKNAPGAYQKKNHLGSELSGYFGRLFYRLSNSVMIDTTFANDPEGFANKLESMKQKYSLILENDLNTGQKISDFEKNGFLDTDFEASEAKAVNEIQNAVRQNSVFNWLIRDRINKDINGKSITLNVGDELKSAKSSIVISTPYLYLSRAERNWLRNWLRENPNRTLTMVTNSISTNDKPMVQTLADFIVAPAFLLNPLWKDIRGQVKMYAYGKADDKRLGGTKIYGLQHAKIIIIDGKITYSGSDNFDPRSRRLNTEVGFLLFGAAAAKAAQARVDNIITQSNLWFSQEWWDLRFIGINTFRTIRQPLQFLFFRTTGLYRRL